MKFIRPNFKNSILNVSATLADFLGVKNDIYKNKKLQKYLNKGYKNVVYLCLDGLGIYPLKQNLNKDSFLIKNISQKITSLFPSTTTNATTSLQSALYPSQHGWFGWSLYFESLKACVTIYTGQNYYTGKSVDLSKIQDILKFTPYFEQASSDYNISTVFPPFVKTEAKNYKFENLDDLFVHLNTICNLPGKQFIYAYSPEPDHIMHDYGVSSKEAGEIIKYLNDKIELFIRNNQNTLLIITPDHGQTDIYEYIELYKDEALMKTLKVPLYLEPRACSFQVKEGEGENFLKEIKKYKKDLKFYKVEDLIRKNYFGPKTEKLKLLGDYIATPRKDDKMILMSPKSPRFKGHHTGLTKKEMILPLIIVEN